VTSISGSSTRRERPAVRSRTAANFDAAKNWASSGALVTCTDVETILLDTRVQRLLYRYARASARTTRGSTASSSSRGAPARRASCTYRATATTTTCGFYNPVAQELGRRVHPILVELKLVDPPVYTVRHVVRPGQTMGQLAVRYARRFARSRLRTGCRHVPCARAAPTAFQCGPPPRRVRRSSSRSACSHHRRLLFSRRRRGRRRCRCTATASGCSSRARLSSPGPSASSSCSSPARVRIDVTRRVRG